MGVCYMEYSEETSAPQADLRKFIDTNDKTCVKCEHCHALKLEQMITLVEMVPPCDTMRAIVSIGHVFHSVQLENAAFFVHV